MTGKVKITSNTIVGTTDLALVLDITGRRVRQLTEDGVFQKTGNGFLLADSVKKYIEMKSLPETAEEDKKIEKAKNKAEALYKTAKAEKAKLEAAELKGKMHRSEDVKALTEDIIYAFRGAVMALPGRLAMNCAACGGNAAEISNVIKKEIHVMLNELAEYEYDDAKYEERVRERMKWEAENEEEDDD